MPTDTSRSRGMRWDDPRLEAVVALTYLAAQTSTIRLGVGVIVWVLLGLLGQKNQLQAAKDAEKT